MKNSRGWNNCPIIQEDEFMSIFGMTSDEIIRMMTLNPLKDTCRIPTEEFIKSFGMIPDEVSKTTGIPINKMDELLTEVADNMNCSPVAMLKMARSLGGSEGLLLNLAIKYQDSIKKSEATNSAMTTQ